MSADLIQRLAALVHDLIDLTPEYSAIRVRAEDAMRAADRVIAGLPSEPKRQLIMLSREMVEELAELVRTQPDKRAVILSAAENPTNEPITVEVFARDETVPAENGPFEISHHGEDSPSDR